MVAGALDFHRLAVEKKALVGVKTGGANAERGVERVHCLPSDFDGSEQDGKGLAFPATRAGGVRRRFLALSLLLAARWDGGGAGDLGHGKSRSIIHEARDQLRIGPPRRRHWQFWFGCGLWPARISVRARLRQVGGDKCSPRRNVDGVGDVQPDMAVNAAALVPPSLVMPRVHVDGQDIFAGKIGRLADVETEGV